MTGPTLGGISAASRLDEHLLRRLVVAVGLTWSVAFVVVALASQLELYGDGAMFSYAVAVQDVWAFHWHNISGRSAVFLLALWPAETLVAISGHPWNGIIAYGFLFYIAPLAGLAATWAADRSPGHQIFLYACGSTALLCPLIFGFPTEMWLAHALFWPTLALSHYARPTITGAILVFATSLLLAFTHEGSFVLLFSILAMLLPRGWRSTPFRRAAVNFLIIVTLAVAVKMFLPPDDYYAEVFLRAARAFFDPAIFRVEIVLALLGAAIALLAIWAFLQIWSPRLACAYALGIVLLCLCLFWLRFDNSVHASSRYYLRTALVIAIPLLGVIAASAAMTKEKVSTGPLAALQRIFSTPQWTCPLAALLVTVTLVHIVETAKFVTAWSRYKAAIASLAMSLDSDPALGDPRFIASTRASPDLAPLAWFSTIPYLSIILSDFRPNRLVIDPKGNYFWLSCATATDNSKRPLAVPSEPRELVRVYSCLHR